MTGQAVRRVVRLGGTEMILFWRNRIALLTALLLPVACLGFYATLDDEARGGMSTNASMLTGLFGFLLLFVVYYNLVTAYVARREELVLKRLRTGEVRDGEILLATAVPAIVVTVAQAAIAVAVGSLLLDLPVPVNVLILVAGLAGGIAVFVLLAAVSTAFTRTVELAQISTMPVLFLCLLGSGILLPTELMPDQVAQVQRFVPLTPVMELVRLGWLGTSGGSAPVGFGEVFAAALAPLAILVGWTVLATFGLRRWFRWEPRR